jgi:Rv0078B-related antitoxin
MKIETSACYHPVVPLSDTSPNAKRVQLEVLRGLSGEQRLLTALEMSDLTRELARAGIRDAHPEWTEAQVKRELLRLAFLPAPLPSGLVIV